jgi:hypothetical protein
MYRILSHSSDSECAVNLQEVLKMSISILQSLVAKWALLHHVDEAGLSLKLPSSMFVSGPVLTLALDRPEKSLMHLLAAISVGSCGGGDPLNLTTISRRWHPEDLGEESLE